MTKTESITLKGSTLYSDRFPPKDAKKGYVAKIKGTAPGMVYDREFFGSEVDLVEGDEGLYERQIGEKKGGMTRYYHVVLSHPEHGLILSSDCESEARKIAKLLDSGISIENAVEVTDLRPSDKVEGRMIFTAIARTASRASKAVKSATIESAVESCVAVLRLLPEAERKKAISLIRKSCAGSPEQSPESTSQ